MEVLECIHQNNKHILTTIDLQTHARNYVQANLRGDYYLSIILLCLMLQLKY